MGLNIKNTKVEKAIRDLAAVTGETLTEAIERAVQERLERIQAKPVSNTEEEFFARLRELQDALKASQIDPDDKRTSQELLDELYDEHGLPK